MSIWKRLFGKRGLDNVELLIQDFQRGDLKARRKAMEELVSIGDKRAIEPFDDKIGELIDLAQSTGKVLIFSEILEIALALKELGDPKGAEYEIVCRTTMLKYASRFIK